MTNINRPTLQTRDNNLITGLQKHLMTKKIILDGVTYNATQLIGLLQNQIVSFNACDAARAALAVAVKDNNKVTDQMEPLVKLLRNTVIGLLGSSNPALADFGIQPMKAQRVQTTEEKALAAQKRRATRKLLNTMGSQQKKRAIAAAASAQQQTAPQAAATTATTSAAATPATAAAVPKPSS